MFAQSSELHMRLVRFILLAGWLSILLLCIVDVGQSRFTDAADPLALEGLVGKTIELRGEILEPVPYNPATRIFWGVAIPLVVLLLIFVGHDTWRRILVMRI